MKTLKIVSAIALALLAVPVSAAPLQVGQPVPNAELVLVNGKRLHLADLRGRVVVLNYWATWCVPCRTELPLLDSYYLAVKKLGWPIEIFAVATEDSAKTSQLKHLFRVLSISPTDRIRGGPFGNVDAVPTNYVIDKLGVLRYAKAGAFDLDDLNSVVGPLLNEPAGAPSKTGN